MRCNIHELFASCYLSICSTVACVCLTFSRIVVTPQAFSFCSTPAARAACPTPLQSAVVRSALILDMSRPEWDPSERLRQRAVNNPQLQRLRVIVAVHQMDEESVVAAFMDR